MIHLIQGALQPWEEASWKWFWSEGLKGAIVERQETGQMSIVRGQERGGPHSSCVRMLGFPLVLFV